MGDVQDAFFYAADFDAGEEATDPVRNFARSLKEMAESRKASVPRPTTVRSYDTPGRGQQGESSN